MLAFGLILLSAAQLVYRFTLPTDGWAVHPTDDFNAPNWVYRENLAGAPSGLRSGDVVTAVNRRSVRCS